MDIIWICSNRSMSFLCCISSVAHLRPYPEGKTFAAVAPMYTQGLEMCGSLEASVAREPLVWNLSYTKCSGHRDTNCTVRK